MAAYLTYALLNDEFVNINDERVSNGYSCGCICPECKEELNARNNATEVEKHFAHKSKMEHKCGYECAIHLLIKKVFAENPTIYLPDYYVGGFLSDRALARKGEVWKFDRVEVEVVQNNETSRIKVDAIGFNGDRKLYVEFANTHFVGISKLNKIRDLGSSCIEVDISKFTLDEIKLKEILTDKNSPIRWLANPYIDSVYRLRRAAELKELEQQEILRQNQIKAKLEKYKLDERVKIVVINFSQINFCALLIKHIKSKLQQRHLNNKTISNILNGAKWDHTFQNRGHYGNFIVVNDKKIWVYPPEHVLQNMSEQERRDRDTLYSGLKTIIYECEESRIGNCRDCQYNIEIIKDTSKHYSICGYK